MSTGAARGTAPEENRSEGTKSEGTKAEGIRSDGIGEISLTLSGGAAIARPSGRLDGVSDLVDLLVRGAGSAIVVVVFDLHDVTEVTPEAAGTMAEFARVARRRGLQVNVIGNDERVLGPLRDNALIAVWNTVGPSATAAAGPDTHE
ncbi:STAS domain-containing protein [Pseudonocardia sp. RS010]|uniref:STAS domain-containing protein n=1 Tax=Pseudonocardia sp. RS010 TaxID=3385979 RepID=UPI0039A318FF